MIGLWRYIINIPPFLWEKQVSKGKKKFEKVDGSLSEEHHLVHHFVVKQLPYADSPIAPEHIADKLGLPVERVDAILNDLEKAMSFLVRNSAGEIIWAYPVTLEKTPHRVRFNTGEQLYAACAADVWATPFVQGRLRKGYLTVTVNTECAHCSRPMEMEIDSELDYSVKEEGCKPIVFVPDVDVLKIESDNIIDGF